MNPGASGRDTDVTAAPEVERMAQALAGGDRRALSRAITLLESTRADHRQAADTLLQAVTPFAGKSFRLGISGVPGVGKSTFIEALGNHLVDLGHRVAVLAVDPSSAVSGGSILGDKTRMETLAARPEAYIRPSPAGRTLGGVARRTFEAVLVCEAAGFDLILVETVGVGQSETLVSEMTDMFLLLLLPGGGDELQGIKRGIVEMADLVVVNKADGELENAAARAAADYQHALHLLRSRSDDWEPPVMTCSALEKRGIAEIWRRVDDYRRRRTESGALEARRREQRKRWLWNEAGETLLVALRDDPRVHDRVGVLEEAVAAGSLPASVAAHRLVEAFLQGRKE